jgi:ABC-2 type transport system permease protein
MEATIEVSGVRKRFGRTVRADPGEAPEPADVRTRPGAGSSGIRDCLHAEWTKLRTAPETIWLLAATMVLTVAVSTAATAATRCAAGIACPVDTTKLSLTGVEFGQAVVAILGARR